MIDNKGRIFGKVSIIDLIILLAVAALALGFVYSRTSQQIQQIIAADTPIYVTFLVEGVRPFSLDAVSEGDIFFRQHERMALGTVTSVETAPAYDIMIRANGTAVYAMVEGRYNMYITLACVGSVTDSGFFINGNLQMAEGGRLSLQSNSFLTMAMVYSIAERE